MVVLKNGRLRLKFWCPSQVKTPRSGKWAETMTVAVSRLGGLPSAVGGLGRRGLVEVWSKHVGALVPTQVLAPLLTWPPEQSAPGTVVVTLNRHWLQSSPSPRV